MQIGSKELIRDINSTLVLETILHSQSISRANIAKKLGLTKATISAIVTDLIAKHLVVEIGSDDTSYGRKPILLKFNQKAGYIISIDLGKKNCCAILTDLTGEEKLLKQILLPPPTPNSPSKGEHLLEDLFSLIDSMLIKTTETPYGLVGICVGIHGITKENQIIFSPYYDIASINLATPLEQHYHVPIFLENEANLSVLGEYSFMFHYPNIANISIHNGVGLGLILDHKLYKGYSGQAGEFGHTIIEIDGRPCPCGNFGCLEQYASERIVLRNFGQLKGLDSPSFSIFLDYYNKQDSDARYIVEQFTKYMKIAVNNIINIYNPNIIIINSSFTNYIPSITESIKGGLRSKINTFTEIVPSYLQDSSILLGGVCVVMKHFLGINYINLQLEK